MYGACDYSCSSLFSSYNSYYTGAIENCTTKDGHVRIYLLVQGSFNLFQLIVWICATAANQKGTLAKYLHYCNGILMVFFIAWTITVSILVWKLLIDWQDDHSLCNNTLFISAMVCLSLHYVMILLMCCCCACALRAASLGEIN